MIDTENWIFRLPQEITKNKKNSIVVIPEDLREDLLKLDLSNSDWYVFGIKKRRSTARRKTFVPAPKMLALNTANKFWKEEIKIKLGFDFDMYYLKSKGANDKLRNKMSLEDVKDIMRHSSTAISKIYATDELMIRMENNLDKFGTFK